METWVKRGRPAPADAANRTARYRPELQGLRALAVALVVVYHVWFNRVSGGVDVFFLVSGFLLTGQLVRAAQRGPIALRPLWGRMATRLLPVALTVLLTTVAAAILVLPEGRWFQTIREVAASALFLQNWRLAADAVDYAAQNNTASVVQHFWSLSIQGQVFVAWPLLEGLGGTAVMIESTVRFESALVQLQGVRPRGGRSGRGRGRRP
ncbi:MAG: acyltransferase family protein, partial [Pseudonocardiales bacterium]